MTSSINSLPVSLPLCRSNNEYSYQKSGVVGRRYSNNNIRKVRVVTDEIEMDIEIPEDKRTAKIILSIALAFDFIQLTVDYPKTFPSKDGKNQIIHKKPVLQILSSSAMPMRIKRKTLAEEALRRLRNTKRGLPYCPRSLKQRSYQSCCSP